MHSALHYDTHLLLCLTGRQTGMHDTCDRSVNSDLATFRHAATCETRGKHTKKSKYSHVTHCTGWLYVKWTEKHFGRLEVPLELSSVVARLITTLTGTLN